MLRREALRPAAAAAALRGGCASSYCAFPGQAPGAADDLPPEVKSAEDLTKAILYGVKKQVGGRARQCCCWLVQLQQRGLTARPSVCLCAVWQVLTVHPSMEYEALRVFYQLDERYTALISPDACRSSPHPHTRADTTFCLASCQGLWRAEPGRLPQGREHAGRPGHAHGIRQGHTVPTGEEEADVTTRPPAQVEPCRAKV